MLSYSKWLEAGNPKHPISISEVQRKNKQSVSQAAHSQDRTTIRKLKQAGIPEDQWPKYTMPNQNQKNNNSWAPNKRCRIKIHSIRNSNRK